MLQLGSLVLSFWTVLNLIPSLAILVNTLLLGGNSPAIYQVLDHEEVELLSTKVRASINSVAIYANGLNVAFCLLALFVIWFGLYRRIRWAFWALLAGFTSALFAGTAGDHVLGLVHPEINILSAILLAVGFLLVAMGLFRDSPISAT